jgi:hypothetical protein
MAAATALSVERRMVLGSFREPPVAACRICALPSRGASAPLRPPSHTHRETGLVLGFHFAAGAAVAAAAWLVGAGAM